jgi:hypothetical protein
MNVPLQDAGVARRGLAGRVARTLLATRRMLADAVLPMYPGHPVTTRGAERP